MAKRPDIAALFEEQVRRTSAVCAIMSAHESVSYADADRRANQLARRLRSLSVSADVLVGLVLDRTPQTLIAMLAIWKAGGAYVPLDPELPNDRLQQILQDARPGVVIATSITLRFVANSVIVDLAAEAHAISQLSADALDPKLAADHLAYCVYTSGTTGRPKGVAVPHGNLVNQAQFLTRALALRPGDRIVQFTSIAMDAALQEILPAWLSGATLVLFDERVPSIHELVRLIDAYEVSVVSAPSSYWHLWVDELLRGELPRPPRLRLVFVGGERILADKLRAWRALPWTSGIEFLADYGPTETTLSCMTFTGELDPAWETVPLGRPIANMRVYVLDEQLAPVAPGVSGELYLAGAGVARGYLDSPKLTAERFVCDPFGPPGSRMYRTGDQGYALPDGQIQFIGRIDEQVKINGRRIELADVRNALLRCYGVRDAIVLSRESQPGRLQLVAYVASTDYAEGPLRARLRDLLPVGMIPSVIVPVAELPRSPVTGKLDRTLLPLVEEVSQTDTIASLFATVLGRIPATHDEDFFEQGGESLGALRLLERVFTLTGVGLTFSEFARAPTIRGLSGLVAAAPARDTRLAPFVRTGAKRRRASHAQQRLWFIDKLHPGSPVYSIPLAYRIRGALSLSRLDGALTEIVARHEALRTRLVDDGGEIWQEIARPMPVRSQHLLAETYAEAIGLANAAAEAPFNLAAPPLLRSTCIEIGACNWLFVLDIHHAVFDAWSLGILWRELRALYNGAPLPPVAYQYADYTQWQAEWLHSPAAAAQEDHWRKHLTGELPVLGLRRRETEKASPRGAQEELRFGAELRASVAELARQRRVTEFVVLLAAFAATLYRHTRQEQIVVGIPIACRHRVEVEGVIGYFTNTVAVRLELAPALGLLDLITRTQLELADAMTCQELPFDCVVNALARSRPPQTSPVFQAMFVMQDTPVDQVPALGGLAIEEALVHSGTAKFDVTCAVRSAGSGYAGELEYSLEVFDATSAARFSRSFEFLLADALAQPTAHLDELRMCSPAEQSVAAAGINGRHDVFAELPLLHARFEDVAAREPELVAIVAEGADLRYGELDRRANALADILVAAGAGPERAIGICMDRSIDLVVALFAVLKSGAAFVPLDPDLPLERVRTIGDDIGLAVIVTRAPFVELLAKLPVQLIVEVPGSAPSCAIAPVSLDAAAYVYYTSGSSGEPKGVVIDHRCAMTRLEWLLQRYQLRIGDHVVHKTPLTFDVAIWEIFGPLSAGATIAMTTPHGHVDVAELSALIRRPCTVLVHFVPSMLDAYLSLGGARAPELRWLHVSGEAVSARLLKRFADHFACDLHNMYGQTETSEVAVWEGRRSPRSDGVPIGRQIGAYRLFVLDAALGLVPPGVPGELCVAGVGGLARGYFGRPELTAERFVPNPYAVVPGERLYRTGDLATLDEDGLLWFLGRIDLQTKIRGCRVEVGDVEAALARHPGVRSCAVIAAPDGRGTNRLVAYYVGDFATDDLAAHAARNLPSYMVPEAYVQLDALPITPSGKLDRRALPPPPAHAPHAVDDQAATPLERQVRRLWQDLLGLDEFADTDNFFGIGGNSLRCLHVLNRVKAAFGVDVSLRVFMGAPTVRGLAAAILAALTLAIAAMSDAEVARRLRALEEGCDGRA